MIRLYVVDNHVKIVAKRNQVSIFFFQKVRQGIPFAHHISPNFLVPAY